VCGEATLREVERLSPHAARVVLDVARLPEPLVFRAGQYAQLRVPGTDQWRSYSFAHAPRAGDEVEFLVRLLPQGAMSDYLRERARAGDREEIRAAKGAFLARRARGLLVAGGTASRRFSRLQEELLRQPAALSARLRREASDLAARAPRDAWRSMRRSAGTAAPSGRRRVGAGASAPRWICSRRATSTAAVDVCVRPCSDGGRGARLAQAHSPRGEFQSAHADGRARRGRQRQRHPAARVALEAGRGTAT
jgi:hypothetical protein